MKRNILALITIVSCWTCTEDNTGAKLKVTYEVLTSERWAGEYIDEHKKRICVCKLPFEAGGWQYTFAATLTDTLHVDAMSTASGETPAVTTNIYVNDKLVASHTSNSEKGVASADFVIK